MIVADTPADRHPNRPAHGDSTVEIAKIKVYRQNATTFLAIGHVLVRSFLRLMSLCSENRYGFSRRAADG